MTPKRVHAAINRIAAVGVELTGRCGLFSRRVPDLFRGSARVHACYAAAADYELGARPLPVPVPAHLELDAAIGTGLIGAGLAMRDAPTQLRALLVGRGLTELLLVSLTDRVPDRRSARWARPRSDPRAPPTIARCAARPPGRCWRWPPFSC